MRSSAKREYVGIITNLGGQRLVLVTGRVMVEVHCLHELRGMRMNHSEEWYTCDRCGEKIKVTLYLTIIRGFRTIPLIPIKMTFHYNEYDLCPKCRKDFERFMKNDLNIGNKVYEMTYRQAKGVLESDSEFVQFSGIIRETGEHVNGAYVRNKITDMRYGSRRFVRCVRIFHLSSKLTKGLKEAALTLEYEENSCNTITKVYPAESENELIEY